MNGKQDVSTYVWLKQKTDNDSTSTLIRVVGVCKSQDGNVND